MLECKQTWNPGWGMFIRKSVGKSDNVYLTFMFFRNYTKLTMLAFLYCFLVKSIINSSKKFTSNGDWTWNPRTVVPLVFILSCLSNRANLIVLVRLRLWRSLCSYVAYVRENKINLVTFSCLPHWANLTLLVRLRLLGFLYSHVLLILAKSSKFKSQLVHQHKWS